VSNKSGAGRTRRDNFKEVFDIFCRAARPLHIPNAPSERRGKNDDRDKCLGIAGRYEDPLWKEMLQGTSLNAVREGYPSGKRNDFTLLLPWGKIFNEVKGYAVPKGKRKRVSDDASKLLEEPPPCAYGLFVLALSALDEPQTDEWVEKAVDVAQVKWWDFEFKETIADEGLGWFSGQRLGCVRLYWYVKDADQGRPSG